MNDRNPNYYFLGAINLDLAIFDELLKEFKVESDRRKLLTRRIRINE